MVGTLTTTTAHRRRVAATLAVLALTLGACGSDESESTGITAPPEAESADGTTAATGGATIDCPPAEGTSEPVRDFATAPPDCLDPGATYTAVVTTNLGEFSIALDPSTGPVAANNFVVLARNRYFDDTVCHRIIPDFVVQCGDPTGTGTGGPGYTIVDEPPTPGSYQVGSIAMAKTQAPDSAGSQFFIITGPDGVALAPEYALFGQVTEGLDTAVAAMAASGSPDGTPTQPVQIQSIRIEQS